MSTQSNPTPESFSTQLASPASTATICPFYWSVRRELSENRSIYLAPLAAAAVFLIGFLINITRGWTIAVHHGDLASDPFDLIAGLMMLTTILVDVFYCADALYGERRDRSILFWKSLPVSDLTTVLAKASIPFVVVPFVAWAIAVSVQWIMLLLSSAVALATGASVSALWMDAPLIRVSLLLLYHLLTAHTLWPAPVFCWLLLVSGWARRAVLLWAVLPVVAIAGLEAIVFRTTHFAVMVATRLIGAAPETALNSPETFPTNPMVHITPASFLAQPDLWLGIAFCVICLAAAVRLRRYQGPI